MLNISIENMNELWGDCLAVGGRTRRAHDLHQFQSGKEQSGTSWSANDASCSFETRRRSRSFNLLVLAIQYDDIDPSAV